MQDDVKSQILVAIGKADNPDTKMLLLLILGVMEEIVDKIDEMRADEKGLREVVLNGHEAVHHTHHEWVSNKIMDEEDALMNNKASRRKIRDYLIEKILWLLLVAAAGSAGWLIK